MLGFTERRTARLIIPEISFYEFQGVSSQSTNVTDGRTDRRTTYHGMTALRHASCGKREGNMKSTATAKRKSLRLRIADAPI